MVDQPESELSSSNDGAEEFDCMDCAAPIVRFGSWPGQPTPIHRGTSIGTEGVGYDR